MRFSILLNVAAFLVLANAIPTPSDSNYNAIESLASIQPDELPDDIGLSQDLGDAEISDDPSDPNKQRDIQPNIHPRYSCDDCYECHEYYESFGLDDYDDYGYCYEYCSSCSDDDDDDDDDDEWKRDESSSGDVEHVDVTFIGAPGINNFSISATIDGNPTNVYGTQVPFSDLSWSQIQNNTGPSGYDFFEKCTLQSWESNDTAQLADTQGWQSCEACDNLWNIGPPQTIKSITCQP